ncbi:UDP-hexose transferase [Altererythrobacter sp. B11]|nr:UDP-hexose transferase [Altererythrobacter sp. B11]
MLNHNDATAALSLSALPSPLVTTPEARSWSDGLERACLAGIMTAKGTRLQFAEMMTADCLAARDGTLAEPRIVVSSNGSVIARYHRDQAFRRLIDHADVVDADGMPMVNFTRLFWKKPFPERVATTDFVHDACRMAAREGLRFYFLGGKPGVAARAADRLTGLYPGLQVVGTRHGYFAPEDEIDLCRQIVDSGADVLWVGLGSPRQEAFAFRQRSRLAGLGWIRTCGGLFDFCSGDARRAPQLLQNLGLEWLYRASLEPIRLGVRYISTNPSAMWHLITKSDESDCTPAERP